MAEVPLQATALPAALEFTAVTLETKPGAALQCSQVQWSGHAPFSNTFVVFLNGLVAPQTFWLPVIALVIRRLKDHSSGPGYPQMLAYDRYGQGKTVDRDPQDESGLGHDVLDVAKDLRQLILQTTKHRNPSDSQQLKILFVANSIGCAVARLYAQEYPGTVAGMILLDSIIANTDFVSVFPDPDATDFDLAKQPEGVSAEMLRETRQQVRERFHPSLPNPEGLNRKTLAGLLPHSDQPQLKGPSSRGPLLTVVGHDPERFAQESLASPMATPVLMSMAYMNPTWNSYNAGLTKITDAGRSKGPIIAKGCGHFVQRDNPQFVADEICDMLDRIAADTYDG